MTTEIQKTEGVTTIYIGGKMDANTAPELENVISKEIETTKELILDMQAVTYLSSAGLRVLLGTHKKMMKSGSMVIKNVRPEVMDIMEITGFADILTIEK
jgi:anti-sigma B factor antagonist